MRSDSISTARLRLALVSPTYFSPESFIGGGERYVEELAQALAGQAEVKFVSFGREAHRARPAPGLERVILRSWTRDKLMPFSPRLARELRGADVVHAFQYYTLPTFLSCWLGARAGAKVFVTDLGGGAWTPGYQVDQTRWMSGHLPLSRYAARNLPGRPLPVTVLLGGVDPERFPMRPSPTHDGSVVFLGRILPHKGIHILIDALPEGVPLHVLGAPSDPAYLERLRALAAGKTVTFHIGLPDPEIVGFLQRAMAVVHPTPVDKSGSAGGAELLGLAPLEGMSCGAVPVLSNAASLPELIEDGVSGSLVPPSDPSALRAGIQRLLADRSWAALSQAAHDRVRTRFTWGAVARRCLAAYAGGEA